MRRSVKALLVLILLTAFGEGLGLAVTTALSAMISSAVPEPDTLGARAILWLALGLAGALEGAILGLCQWFALVAVFPGLGQRRYVFFVSLSMAVSWLLASGLSLFESDVLSATDAISSAGVWVATVMHAALVGLCVGAGQVRALRGEIRRKTAWIGISVSSWILGMLTTPMVAWSLSTDAPIFAWIATTAGSGALVGTVVGIGQSIGIYGFETAVRPRSEVKETPESAR